MRKVTMIEYKIDRAILSISLQLYKEETGLDAILLMNSDTAKVLKDQLCIHQNETLDLDCMDKAGTIGEYKAHKIFIDNDLKFGEVEVR